MSNTFRTVQWNIGGGNVRANSASTEYDIDGLDAIIEKLEAVDPDLITLQETHTADGYSQAEIVSKALQLPYWVNDEYGESHINPAYRIGQAIISRFPLADTDFRLFLDSGYKAEWATRTHDKGVTSATVLVNDTDPEAGILTVNTTPGTITGTMSACVGATTTLSSSPKATRTKYQETMYYGYPTRTNRQNSRNRKSEVYGSRLE